MTTRVEYIGFRAATRAREYRLRVTETPGEHQVFTVVIPNEAFLSRRVRYQDAPEICFWKLQRALEGSTEENEPPAQRLEVTNAELEEYRVAHTPKPRAPARKRVDKG